MPDLEIIYIPGPKGDIPPGVIAGCQDALRGVAEEHALPCRLVVLPDGAQVVPQVAPGALEVIQPAGKPAWATAIRLGGRDLHVSSLTVRFDPESLPVAEFSLPVVDGAVLTLEPRWHASEETRAALVAMGWTPPAHDSEPEGEAK